MTLTDRDRKLLLIIIPLALLGAFWFLVLSPKREEAAQAADELTQQQQRRDAAKAVASAAQGAKRDFTADYAQIVRLGKAVPAQVDMPSLLVQLDAAAAGTGIQFTRIATGERQALLTQTTTPPADSAGSETPVAAGGAQAQSPPGTAAESANNAQATSNQRSNGAEQSGVAREDAQTSTSSGGSLPVGSGTAAAAPTLEAVPLELEFIGDFFKLADFFHGVKRFVRVAGQNVMVGGRLITIDGVRWSSDPEIFPRIRAEITATIYLSPKAQGTTAGTTPSGPAPEGTPATVPPAGAPEASPAPTATTTGATP